jgi:hypothetical protein
VITGAGGSTSEIVADFSTVYARSRGGWRIVFDAAAGPPAE